MRIFKILHLGMLNCLNKYNMAYPTIINTEHFCFKSFILLSEDEHKTIWQIRNNPEIRMYMDNPDSFPYENHQRFVSSLVETTGKAYYGVYLIGGVN